MKHRMVVWRMSEQDKHSLMTICSQFSHLYAIRQQLIKVWERAEESTPRQGEQND
jgi:hypothetical protein